jgi:hypothetical protein
MKHLFTTLIALTITILSFAAPVIKAKTNNGDWTNNSTWNLNREPKDNDTIVIPAGITVIMDKNRKLDKVIIRVFGILDFNNGKLDLDKNSSIIVEYNGRITGSKNSEFIKIEGVEKYRGTGADIIGYAFANSTTGNGFSVGSSLPVVFNSFFVSQSGSNVKISWTTSQEVNNSRFVIERSFDGRNWNDVAAIAGAGSSTDLNKYDYTDKNINASVVYYRIRQVDVNGHTEYSAIRTVRKSNGTTQTNMYATKQTVTIDFNSEVKNNVVVQVLNENGQVVARQDYQQASYSVSMNIPTARPGIYIVVVSDNNGWREVKKFLF